MYGRKFAYGTVVELCVAHNKRRRSSKRYRGLAKVTTRRARKGFSLRFNPDSHWSASFYKGLNKLQYEDGRNILNVNRDDATGFRLDTLTTCKQHANPVTQGYDILTTRTDYVNKYPSIIQTTSYNFTCTNTTGEVCVGVVKAPPIHSKNPTQHYSDIQMLSQMEDLLPVFHNQETSSPKEIDCIRVDGASDEGPAHEIVQYYWTEWHINHGKVATLITSRCSGSSYLNRVELQNGCLSLGHSNTFIPSTLGGSCIDPNTGKVDQTKLKENLNLAITVYMSRVDGCPCGETYIKLVKGSNSDAIQEVNKSLLVYLKGSKKSKDSLSAEMPALYKHFDEVWSIRNRHMVRGLPQSYIFFLKCCYQPGCTHSKCKSPPVTSTWYPGGPTLSQLPLLLPDPQRPWGNSTCTTCKEFCSGHYCSQMVDIADKEVLKQVLMPPSTVLNQIFSNVGDGEVSDELVSSTARKVLLSTEDVKLWLKHLTEVVKNRKRGAAKAAETRRKKKATNQTTSTTVTVTEQPATVREEGYCASCGVDYASDTGQFWIACDLCEQLYCASCEGLTEQPTTETYLCSSCCAK